MAEKRPRRPQAKGKCVYCGAAYTKSGMSKHLLSCDARDAVIEAANRESKAKPKKWLLLEIAGARVSGYWIYLEFDASASLKVLDQFLRDIWLECCGHLSKFEIEGRGYATSPMGEFGERSMNLALEKVMKVGTEAHHEYDYGSTTELVLKVVGERHGASVASEKPYILLARNDAPVFECDHCHQQTATMVCTFCIYGADEIFLCEKCKEQHACYKRERDDYFFLPVVNSPRMGECGYTGSEIYPS